MIDLLLPIAGVSEDLIRAINLRFAQVPSAAAAAVAAADPPGVFFLAAARPDANGTKAGTFGAETDTGLLYQVQTVGSRQQWVLITSAALSYGFHAATGNLTLPQTTFSDVPGATITIATAGKWLFAAIAIFAVVGAGDANAVLSCGLNLAGALQTTKAIFNGGSGITASVAQMWVVSAAVGNVAKLQGSKQGGATGTSALTLGTTIFGLRLGS